MSNRFEAGLSKIKGASGKAPAEPAKAEPPATVSIEAAAAPAGKAPPSRAGKVVVSAYFDNAVRQQLAILAVKQDKSQAAMLAEALNLLFEKYGEAPIARA